jgi:hypothetical protein
MPTAKKLLCAALCASLGASAGACANMSETEKGAGIGALVGAAIGAAAGGRNRDILIGAALGAAVGGIVGHYRDRQIASRAQAAQVYTDGGAHLEIEKDWLAPGQAARNDAVESAVQYTVLAPQAEQSVHVTETRSLVGGQETVRLAQRAVDRGQGTHTSTFRFVVPKNFPKGSYTLVTEVTDGCRTRTSRVPLVVT